ncbi:hypothetical protein [Roseococcus pinisoli]|uniref:Uncharacterized protein n=1 Tax=Roseococcus pinisoli TaxID=2835040 RepID=A0ABS5QL21_9PROT|nr:hypothetical protein [Roseococcus pinisoli]MBS7813785.1 hypothetical protein [Roseococcus pinisoli]
MVLAEALERIRCGQKHTADLHQAALFRRRSDHHHLGWVRSGFAVGVKGTTDVAVSAAIVLLAEVSPAPRLYQALAQIHRDRVAEFTRLLDEEDAAKAREMIRGLVGAIRPILEACALRICVRGELGVLLRLAAGAINSPSVQKDNTPAFLSGRSVSKVTWGAGTRSRRPQIH